MTVRPLVGVLLLVVLALNAQLRAQPAPAISYPGDYKATLVKYAVVDRSDGMSRDLYVSRNVVDAVTRDPQLREFPVGALFALDVYSARLMGRDPKTGASRFQQTPDGHLIRANDERTLHLMQKIQPGFGSRNWVFGGFDPRSAEALKLQLPGDCQLCHQAAVVSDMTFSMNLLKTFVAGGSVQYRFCSQPGRQPCPFQ
jgi:hypothetical protein